MRKIPGPIYVLLQQLAVWSIIYVGGIRSLCHMAESPASSTASNTGTYISSTTSTRPNRELVAFLISLTIFSASTHSVRLAVSKTFSLADAIFPNVAGYHRYGRPLRHRKFIDSYSLASLLAFDSPALTCSYEVVSRIPHLLGANKSKESGRI